MKKKVVAIIVVVAAILVAGLAHVNYVRARGNENFSPLPSR